MMKLRFLVPGTGGIHRCGGLLVELQTARMLVGIATTEIVTYRQREDAHPFLDDLLRAEPLRELGSSQASTLWVVSWGFDVPALLRRLQGRAVAYHAHSSGYGFDLPPGVPVLAVSRNTLGYWGDRAPRNPLFLVPNALEPQWLERGARHRRGRRCIDVLVQQRKCSSYVLKQLVPALRSSGLRVEVQSGWVEDLVDLFNSACVYLYDSSDYWHGRGVSEGFGLPPVEALACGCVVFSSFNHALADTLDPTVLGHQIGCGTLENDLTRIAQAVTSPEDWLPPSRVLDKLLCGFDEKTLNARWSVVLGALDDHWSRIFAGQPPLRSPWLERRPAWQRVLSAYRVLRRRLGRSVV